MIFRQHPSQPDFFTKYEKRPKREGELEAWRVNPQERPPLRIPWDKDTGIRDFVKLFSPLFSYKCVYCETTLEKDPSKWRVDFFRPRENARQDKQEADNDYYLWLSWTWANFYFACNECYVSKGMIFPTKDAKRAGPKINFESLADAERPLLLDPCNPKMNPLTHLKFFENGEVIGTSDEGRRTVEILKLNDNERQSLIETRRAEAERLKLRWNAVLDMFGAGNHKQVSNEVNTLLELCDDNQAFAGMKRQLLESWFLRASFDKRAQPFRKLRKVLTSWLSNPPATINPEILIKDEAILEKLLDEPVDQKHETSGWQIIDQILIPESTPVFPKDLEDTDEPTDLKRPIDNPDPPVQIQPDTPPIVITLDFLVRGKRVQITWRSALWGGDVTTFNPPYSDIHLPLVIRALDVLQYPNYPIPNSDTEQRHFAFSQQEQELLTIYRLWSNDRVTSQAHELVGEAIFKGLGARGQNLLMQALNIAIREERAINYVLRFPPNAINLASLPWEALWDNNRKKPILIRSGAKHNLDSCERYIDLNIAPPSPRPAEERLHLLALCPTYGIPDQIRQQEQAARRQSWDKLRADGRITYDEISPLTMKAVNNYLINSPVRPDIVHYYGHGTYRNGMGFLLFDKDKGGKDLVSSKKLAAVLGNIRLIVLCACQSAMVDAEGGLVTGIAPALSMDNEAVVAMQLTVRVEAATRFSEVFYNQLLAQNKSLQYAVSRVRQVLYTEEPDGESWYVLTLYIRGQEQKSVFM